MALQRKTALRITLVTAVFTAVIPILVAILVAREQGLRQEYERVSSFTRDVLYRSDRAVAQMQEGLALMSSELSGEPSCSPRMIGMLQELGLTLTYLDMVGHQQGNRLLCSSLGMHQPPLDLGEADLMTLNGNELRLNVRFPINPDNAYNILSSGGFAVLASSEQAIDLNVEQPGLILATFIPGSGRLRIARGEVDPAWIAALGDRQAVQFVDDGHIVSVMQSEQIGMTGALAAIPVTSLNQRITEFTLLLLPIGLLTAILLTVLVLYLARQRLSLAAEIRMALRRDELFLVYQPIVDLKTGAWTGAEALVRWRRRDGELVMPDAFIPAAEQNGLITAITHRVIELAGRDMEEILRRHPDFRLSINLSAEDLQSDQVIAGLDDMLARIGGNPCQLMVELTERILLNPELAHSGMEIIRDRNIQLAIDDFGTGYSSLSYLEKMEFDFLKIDKLFVEAIDTGAATNQVVLHIIEMARTLGIGMVAEGVETTEQAEFLRARGVEYAQGWLFGRPMSAELLASGLEDNRGLSALSETSG